MPKIYTINDQYIVDIATDFINRGKVICFPTETVYALSCSCYDIDAIKKIFEIKMRDSSKALSIICGNIDQIKEIAHFSPLAIKLANKFSPGPLTLILKAKDNLPKIINHNLGTIGVRIPNNKFALELLNSLGAPLIGTSVNISSEQSATSVENISREIYDKIDMIIDGGKTELEHESTIIDVTTNIPKILRQGAIKEEIIFEALK